MHLDLELFSAEGGRIEGSVGSNAGGERVTFSGWLELLRLLEATVSTESSSRRGTCSTIP